jgi:hypothetical protein
MVRLREGASALGRSTAAKAKLLIMISEFCKAIQLAHQLSGGSDRQSWSRG